MPNGKARGCDIVPADPYKLLEDNGVATLCKLFNEWYDSGTVAQEIMDSIFVPIPKKVRAFDCGNFQTISLLKDILKIFFKVLLDRINRVQHNILFELLSDLDTTDKNLRIIQNVYFHKQVVVRLDNEISEPVEVFDKAV